MRSRYVIYPYVVGSASARELARGLGTKQVRENGRYRPRATDIIINWGNPRVASAWGRMPHRILNSPAAIARGGNKLAAFAAFRSAGVRTPEWTTNQEEAAQWIRDGKTAVCRTLLNAHSGRGIVIASNIEALVRAPLYTQYTKKKKEFRIHVFRGEVIDVQEKRRRRDYQGEVNSQVRSYHTGWVYCREDIAEPAGIRDLAIAAVGALALDFAAVDIIWNERSNTCYVLEVNTAPGLQGTTLNSYINAIRRVI